MTGIPVPRSRSSSRKAVVSKVSTNVKSRRVRAARLDPEVRRRMILDAAGQIVLQHGVSNCTPELVAAASNVSKALIYKYFPSRELMLGALIQREFDYIRGRHENLIAPEAPIADTHRVYIRRYMEYLLERGPLMRALINDAGVVAQLQTTAEMQHKSITRFWVERTMEAYGLPKDLARMGMIMTIAALDNAEGSLRIGKIDLDRAADFWTTFILAGWEAAGARFGETTDPARSSD